MGKFYYVPRHAIIGCIMLITAVVIVQTMGIVYRFRRLNRDRLSRLENVTEGVVLLHLLVLARIMAEISYHANAGFVYPSGFQGLRYLLFLILLVLCAMVSRQRRLVWPMGTPLAAALTLPVTERLTAGFFPVLFLAALGFWMVRCLHLMLLRRGQQSRGLSLLSVKEAVDNLDSGLLFCQEDGQILLQNSRMQQLSVNLTGAFFSSGRDFYDRLLAGQVLEGCRKSEMGSQLAYWLPDGSLWVFDLHRMEDQPHGLLLVATDNTAQWQATHQLWLQNRELEARNRELKQLLENLESICKTEQTIRAKSRVHDVLGQRISLLLRAMRERQEPDEVLLNSFASGLPDELTWASVGDASPMDTLIEVFRGLGVTVTVEGLLTGDEDQNRTLYEIAAEAVTNAVRHGYASEVRLRLTHGEEGCTMTITDNGLPSQGPVQEGGGLKGMRRKAEELGGSFTYRPGPGFPITVTLPRGDAECTEF